MAQFNKNEQDFLNQERTLFEVNMIANKNGEVVTETNRFPVSIGDTTGGTATFNTEIEAFPDSAISAFEEPLAVTITPLLQQDGVYGLDTDLWDTIKINGGTVGVATTTTSVWSVGIGTSTNSFSRLYTTKFVRYQPGQGMMFRWTAAYTCSGLGTSAVGITSIPQLSGAIDRGEGYAFGFSGIATIPNFGIRRARNGKVEVRDLTITTAPTGAQTATITLDGTAYTVSLTSSASTQYTAAQIADRLKKQATVSQYWTIEACGSIVTFTYFTHGPRTGTYSFSSTGTGTLAAGSFVRIAEGSAPEEHWTYINDWENKPTNFDPSKLNVYGVDFRWLGSGAVRFFVEDPSTGKMLRVYTQKFTSTQLYPHLSKPSLRMAYEVGNTVGVAATQAVTVYGASIFAGVQGIINQTGMSQGYYALNPNSQDKDNVHHLLSIQNSFVRNGIRNKSQLIVENLTVSTKSVDPSVIYIIKNAVGTSDLLVFNPIPNSFVQASTSNVTETLSSDILANVQTIGVNGSATFDLLPYNVSLAPGDYLSVFMSSTTAFNSSSVGITWKVD